MSNANPGFFTQLTSIQSNSPVLGMQLWHLLAIIGLGISVLLTAVCCFLDWRIPRTRKEIELDRQLRKMADQYAEEMMEKMKVEEEQGGDATDVGGPKPAFKPVLKV